MGSLSINRVICFRKEPESTDIRTHLDGKLKGVHIGQQPQPIRNSCIATHVYMSRRRPLGENVAHTQKKMGNLWPYIQRASEPRFSLTMDWWWMAIGPSLTISARERETKFSTPVIHTQKKTKYFFPSFLKVDINRLVKVSLASDPIKWPTSMMRAISFLLYYYFWGFSWFGMKDIGTRADSIRKTRQWHTNREKEKKKEQGGRRIMATRANASSDGWWPRWMIRS